MVLLIIIPFLNGYFIGNIPHFQVQTHLELCVVLDARVPRLCIGTPEELHRKALDPIFFDGED